MNVQNDNIIQEQPEENLPKIDMDRIKIFLKVRPPEMEDKSYYDIDTSKNIFTLYDQLIKGPSGKSKLYEIDKIFTNDNENSYIYEEICRDCIKESLKGFNFCFFSYGETSSDKFKMLYGNIEDSYTNINNRGIFPRLLDQYIKTINDNEEYKNNYSLNLSSMCINQGKIIDLSSYMGKEISGLKENAIFNSGIEIGNNKEILNSIKKVPIENCGDVVFFLNKVFSHFIEIDYESIYHLYSWSYFIFNIYITDNNGKNISNLIFVILNGSEQLNSMRNYEKNEPKKKTEIQNPTSPNKKLVELSKNIVITQYTYDNIINYINNNKELNKINDDKEEEEDDKGMSKLIIVLYNILFGPNVKKMKYRFIGSIVPSTGFYLSVKDTLDYLFKCKNIIRKKKQIIGNKDLVDKKEKELLGKKDDMIFDLENKIKIQAQKIEELNKNLDGKDNKIKDLEKTYKKQVEVLKSKFNFNGDVNILLSGNEYTKEAKFARNIREAKENVRIYQGKVNELEEKLKQSKETIKKITTQKEITENDKTMVSYYQNLKSNKENHEYEIKLKNEYSKRIDVIQNELNNSNKIIEELRNEIEKKNQILFNLPDVLQKKSTETFNIKNLKDEQKKRYEEKFKKKLGQIEENNSKEMKNLIDKYENLLKQKDLTIKGNNNAYDTLKLNYDREVKNYSDELIKIDETLMNIITIYKSLYSFKSGYSPNLVTMTNLKNEFDKTILNIENNINNYTYPLLFKSLLQNNKLGIHNTDLQSKKILKRPKSSYQSRVNNNINNEEINNNNKSNILKKSVGIHHFNTKTDNLKPSIEQIQKNVNKQISEKIILKEDLDKMEKEEIINYCLEMNKRINNIEDYIEKYAQYKRGFNIKEFELTESHVANLYDQIKRLNKNIDEQVDINNRNKIIIESQNRTINNLKNENLLLKNQLEGKELNERISYPVLNNQTKTLSSRNNINSYIKSTNNFIYTVPENTKYNEMMKSNNPTFNNRIQTDSNIKSTYQKGTNTSTQQFNVFNQGNKMKRPSSASNRNTFKKN